MRKIYEGIVVIILFLLLGLGLPPAQPEASLAQTQERPNIIFVLTDDQSEDTLWAMPIVQSELKAKGTTYENFTYTLPRCCPSRATMLTGKYPHNHGVLGNYASEGGGEPTFRHYGNEGTTVATWLDSAGYRTGLFGKYLNGYDIPSHVPPSWDRWFAGYNRDGWATCFSSNGNSVCTDRHPDSFIAEKAEAFVENNVSGEPLFMWVSFSAPHGPAHFPQMDAGRFQGETMPRKPSFNEADVSDKPWWMREKPSLTNAQMAEMDAFYRDRLRSLQTVDRSVARLISLFSQANELDNTYFFLVTDNGYHMGEHRLKNGKETPYSEDVSFPLIVRGPGVPQGIDSHLVSNTDLAPTFAELGGASGEADGRSIVPLFRSSNPQWRDALYIHNGPSKLMGSPAYDTVRTTEFSYVEFENGERELYDLQADPYQLQNVYGDHLEIERELAGRLQSLRGCAGNSCRAAEDAP